MCSACLALGQNIHFSLEQDDGGPLGLNNDDRGGTSSNGKPSLTVEGAGGTIGRSGLSWGPGATVTFAFRSSAPSTMPDDTSGFSVFSAQQIAQTLLALESWSDAANITFARVGGSGYSNDATILFANYSSGSDGAAAFAYLPGDASVGAVHGDVWVNSSIWYNSAPAYLNYGRLVLTHEIGHAIGLRHPGDYNASVGSPSYADADYYEDSRQFSVMSYWSEANTGADFQGYFAAAPLLDDIAAIQLVYGVNTTTRTGDTTYGFNSNAGRDYYSATSNTTAVIFAVWDAGGYDTLDFSGYTHHQTIDLRQGAFSSVGGLIGNVSIAQGAVIEHAVGGVGNDTMYAQAYVAPVAVADLAKAQGQVNNSIATAFSIDGAFDRMFDNAIISSTSVPHATVNAVAHGGLEYFSFTGGAGETVTVDIDGTVGIDTVVRIYSSGGALLASNDDGPIDVGSSVRQDSFLSFTLPAAGTYYIVVGSYAGPGTFDNVDYEPLAAGSAFTLNVSLSGVDTPGGAVTGSTLEGGGGADTLHGNIGGDILQGGAGDDTINGGDGDDTAVFSGNQADYSWSESGGVVTVTGADGTDTLTGVEFLQFDDGVVPAFAGGLDYVGTPGVDVVEGTAFDDVMSGGGGNDRLSGLGGNDTLTGDDGDDVLNGGDGNDVLDGRSGADRMVGGAGNDYYVFDNRSDRAVEEPGGGIDTVRSTVSITLHEHVENLFLAGTGSIFAGGNGENNRLVGNSGNNEIQGGAGIDRMEGGLGDDSFLVDSRQDTIIEFRNEGTDTVRSSVSWTLHTNLENLTLIGASNTYGGGNAKANVISGNSGNNTLYGGALGDTLKGGDGRDTFLYLAASDSTVANPDRILDLRFNETIDLSAIDADSTVAGDQAFAIVDDFTNQAGQMTVTFDAGTGFTSVLMDIDGDGVADMLIQIAGNHEAHTDWGL